MLLASRGAAMPSSLRRGIPSRLYSHVFPPSRGMPEAAPELNNLEPVPPRKRGRR